MNKKRRSLWVMIPAVLAMVLVSLPVQATTISWTDWTSMTPGTPGSASGTMAFPTGDVTVSYSGQVYDTSHGYWLPASTFISSPAVDNAPPGNGNIALTGGGDHTLTFSKPVVNPIMAVLSLGGGSTPARLVFTTSFSILHYGPNETYTENGWLSKPDDYTLLGQWGGNGIIQFQGTYSSITFLAPDTESWYMFTVGAPAAVPLPASVLLLGSGLAGLAAMRRRLRK